MRGFSRATGMAMFFLAATSTVDAAESLVTLRTGAGLDANARHFVKDARETADRDAWGYLSPEVKGAIQALEVRHGFRASRGYSKVLQGFAADLSAEQIERLRFDPLVESIAVTVNMASTEQQVPWGVTQVGASAVARGEDDQVALEVHGVTVYVIDSGIDGSNPDLNVVKQVNFAGGPKGDCNGHGTHVAGIIGARDNDLGVRGVAPGVALVGVKVVDCSGSGSSAAIIKGIDWVAGTAKGPAVVNLSLGGGASPSLDAAVKAASAQGIFFAIAAGNAATDACLASPSANGFDSGIVTVGAIDASELEAPFSNFGGCVDVWAPGVSIASIGLGANEGVLVLSGTSMAAPHVAGAAALYLSHNPTASPLDVESALLGSSVVPGTASKDGRTILRLKVGGAS